MVNDIKQINSRAIQSNDIPSKKLLKKTKRFLILNWRIIILLFLLIASISFILWSNSEVDQNFINQFQ